MIHIEIKTDNAAFADHKAHEIARILAALADKIRSEQLVIPTDWLDPLPLMGVNGDRVGQIWEVQS